jgi:hypothetical protein
MASSIIGWGWIVSRLFGPRGKSTLQMSDLAPFGLSGLYVLGGVANIFFPLDGPIDWLAAMGGWLGCLWAFVGLRGRLPDWRILAVMAALLALVATGTVVTPLNYDAGLYHFQVLKFAERGPIPLGLANIHSRFGFNSAAIVLASLFRGPVFGADGAFLLSAAIFLLFSFSCFEKAFDTWRTGNRTFSGLIAGLFLLGWIANVNGLLFEWYSLGPNGDIPGAVFCCWTVLMFFLTVESVDDEPCLSVNLTLFALCSVLCVVIKVTQGPVLLLLPAAFLLLRRHWPAPLPSLRLPAMLAGAVALTWLAVGVLTSGCLAFPFASTCLTSLRWTVDPEQTREFNNINRAWARAPGMNPAQALTGWSWLSGWFGVMLPNRPIFRALQVTAALGLVIAGLLRLARARLLRNAAARWLHRPALTAALMVSGLGICVWFWAAPDPRFALGFFLSFIVLLWAGVTLGASGDEPNRLFITWAGRIIASLLLLAAAWEVKGLAIERANAPKLAWRTPPAPALRTSVTRSGLTVRIPLHGDQCWDEAGLCAPGEVPDLSQTSRWGHTVYIGHPAKDAAPGEPSR